MCKDSFAWSYKGIASNIEPLDLDEVIDYELLEKVISQFKDVLDGKTRIN